MRLPHASHFSPTYVDVALTQGLPAMTEEVNLLNGELTTCMEQVEQFQARGAFALALNMLHYGQLMFCMKQDALGETYAGAHASAGDDDDDLQAELDEILGVSNHTDQPLAREGQTVEAIAAVTEPLFEVAASHSTADTPALCEVENTAARG